MFHYTPDDRAYLKARADQFRAQVARRVAGTMTEDEFRPFRLLNGLYLQLHAYMLRVAIPYGTLSANQMRALADIADQWDRGYGHFTTRQNIQFNWPELRDVPDMLDALAAVDMHAVQTSGNTVRNVTADHYAGAARDEVADPRPYAELLRQWSTDHPEFQFLPRKFKIAVTGGATDRAVTRFHDLGLRLLDVDGQIGFQVIVGGGLGRTPMIGQTVRDFLSVDDLLAYVEAVVSVFNEAGRRDNKYKARIKILLHESGLDGLKDRIETRFAEIRGSFGDVSDALLPRLKAGFAPPAFKSGNPAAYDAARANDPVFRAWSDTNLTPHRRDDHRIVTISLKSHGAVPGDASSAQMRVMADLAERYGYGELRVSHEQNIILPHVHLGNIHALWLSLRGAGLGVANLGLASDIIACPGLDYCGLATARSIPVAQRIAIHLRDEGLEDATGPLKIKISGCINACGHHHVGDIGILGLDRGGVETYQITLGGRAGHDAAIGTRAGPGFSYDDVVGAVDRLVRAYLDLRAGDGEAFADALLRLGTQPFIAALYESDAADAA